MTENAAEPPSNTATGSGWSVMVTVDITITEDENASLDGRQYQRRLATIEWDWEGGHGATEFEYFVKGLYGVISGSE